ncbi:COP9 signalosome complex subunit 4-like [Syzygium oleosum]|uniref:COP9 signalosome complex subunit 4-like n=1 Tax=Syzygium oleosum TaxID=219896 RepID=UPI0024BABCB3|nr:COP9 signalosome complex subunit 4-like [Syzygium oleosum]
MEGALASASSIMDQRQRIEQYKHILAPVLASNDIAQAKKFIDHMLSDDVPLVVSRQLLQNFAQELGVLAPETQKEIAHYTLAQIQPRVVSFEEQPLIIREKLAELYESEQQWSKAAQMLSGIDLDSAMRMIDDNFRLSKCVQIARLYLEDDDAVNAEAFINKASFLVSNSQHEVLNLQYKVCYARILDLKRKFLEAALRYYDISQIEKRQIGDEEMICSKRRRRRKGGRWIPGLGSIGRQVPRDHHMSSATSSYWCYRCSRFIRVWSQDSITCPNYNSRFVEEIENASPPSLIATDARRRRFTTAAMYTIRSQSGQDQSPDPVPLQFGHRAAPAVRRQQ